MSEETFVKLVKFISVFSLLAITVIWGVWTAIGLAILLYIIFKVTE